MTAESVDQARLMAPSRHIFLSPHYDDIALSCGGTARRIAEAGGRPEVALIFGDHPDPSQPMTEFAESLHRQWGLTAEQVIAGPETEVSDDKTRATTRMLETVQDGVLQRSWCIIPGDPPGTYTYDITIDGEPRGEFVFCAIEMPDQNTDIDPRDLSCPNKFNSVQRAPLAPGLAHAGAAG